MLDAFRINIVGIGPYLRKSRYFMLANAIRHGLGIVFVGILGSFTMVACGSVDPAEEETADLNQDREAGDSSEASVHETGNDEAASEGGDEDVADVSQAWIWGATVGHCWSCGGSKACYDSHSVNYCLALCSGEGDYYVVGSATNQWGNCTTAAHGFCAGHGRGLVHACWGRNW
jgi:hypothetical protein